MFIPHDAVRPLSTTDATISLASRMHTSYSFHVSEGHIVASIWKHGGECIRFAIVTRKPIAYHLGNQLYFLRQPGRRRTLSSLASVGDSKGRDYACVQVSVGGGLDFGLRQTVYLLATYVGNMERLVSHPPDSTAGSSE